MSYVALPASDDGDRPTELVDATEPVFEYRAPKSVSLGFHVRAVRTFEQLERVCELRQRAFSRRQPELAASLREPETADFERGNIILMAVRHSTQEIVGTARMQTNLSGPLEYETHIALPESYRGLILGACSRLAVAAGADSANVTRLLFKTFYWYSLAQQVSHLLITAEPPRDRLYRLFGFRDLYPGRLYRTESTPQYGCKLLSLDLGSVRRILAEVNPSFLAFLDVYSPDIEIFTAGTTPAWAAPRREDRRGVSSPSLARRSLA